VVENFAAFGRNLGIAFQIIDDVLDLVGEKNRVGKTLGTDLLNRKPTLPVIHCLKNSSDKDRRDLLGSLSAAEPSVTDIISHLDQTGSLQYAQSVAQDHARNASRFAQSLDDNPYSKALLLLANFVLERTH
jgi:geranylgeranyl pyrophosphate synthase